MRETAANCYGYVSCFLGDNLTVFCGYELELKILYFCKYVETILKCSSAVFILNHFYI